MRSLAGVWLAALFTLAGCSKDAVDEQKVDAHRGTGGMNPGMNRAPQDAYPYPAPGYGTAMPPQAPMGSGQGRYTPPAYGTPYPTAPGQTQPPVNPGYPGWQPQGAGVPGWTTSPQAGYPASGYPGPGYGQGYQGYQGYGNPGQAEQAMDWALQGQQRNNPWAGANAPGWQSPATPAWNVPQAPRYRPLDEDEKERARQGSNPWVAPYDKPIGSSHSERPSPPTVPGLVSPEVMNPYSYGVYAPGLYGTGLPTLGFYPGVPGVLGPWGW